MKKFTDDEIIKALDCCGNESANFCSICPLYIKDNDNDFCQEELHRMSFDLISSQKAEIERLQKECEITRAYIHNNGLEWGLVSHLEFYKNQRAEAIKEFAERLKSKAVQKYDWNEYVEIEDIDNLIKEMGCSE